MPIAGERVQGSAVSGVDALVEFKLGNDEWAAVDSWATRVTVTGGDVPFSSRAPFKGAAEIFVGKRNPYEISVEILYTEGSTDPFAALWDAQEESTDIDLDVRWSPNGEDGGGFRFTSIGGKMGTVLPPDLDSESEEPTVMVVPVRAGAIERDVQPPA